MINIRKSHISDLLTKLITENTDYDVSMLLKAVLRRKNFKNKRSIEGVFHLDATDEQLSLALEETLKDLKER